MQNVACAMTIVQKDSSRPRNVRKPVRKASAVTMPGRAIGSTTSNDSVCLPKNVYLPSANARSVPSTSATVVATMPTSIEVSTADRTLRLPNVSDHQCVVNDLGGQANTVLALNELMMMTPSGT